VTVATVERPAGPSRLRIAAGALFWLMVAVTLASAFLRLAEGAAVGGLAIDLARGLHRIAASAALLVAIGLAVAGWDRFRPLMPSRAVAASLVALGLALAFLGRFTPSTHPLVALGNPLGGLAMAALAWWLWRACGPPPAFARRAALGWGLVGTAAAIVAAIVVWPPALGPGLALQVVATGLLAVGVTCLHAAADR
jgi:hypothetical protein